MPNLLELDNELCRTTVIENNLILITSNNHNDDLLLVINIEKKLITFVFQNSREE